MSEGVDKIRDKFMS